MKINIEGIEMEASAISVTLVGGGPFDVMGRARDAINLLDHRNGIRFVSHSAVHCRGDEQYEVTFNLVDRRL